MKYIQILSTALLILIFTGCNDDLLVEKPQTFISPTNFYQTPEDAQLALTGVYASLQADRLFQQSGWSYFYGDMGTDIEVIPTWGYQMIGNYSGIDPQHSYTYKNWGQFYHGILRANTVLNRVGDMSDDLFEDQQYGDEWVNEKNVILGEAYFLRALLYFHAVMYFGNIPLILEETTGFDDANVSQVSPETTYNQVVADLQMAVSYLPLVQSDGSYGHATKGAAKSLLGKVYLGMTGFPLYQTDKFSLAAQEFKDVIDKGIYTLMPFYGDIFDWQNESSNTEMIFAVKYGLSGIGESGNTGSYQGILGAIADGAGYENTYVNETFAYSYDSSDVRFWWNVSNRNALGNLNSNAYWGPWKWHKPKPNNWGGGGCPFDRPLIRYADVLLMYAEALNGANTTPPSEAYWAINQVRQRARLNQDAVNKAHPDWLNVLMDERLNSHPTDANVLPDLSGLSKEGFLEALLQEQAWECCWEGKRKPMLIRTGKLQEYISEPRYEPQIYNYNPGLRFDPSMHYWFPIPQKEIDLNPNLVQNPGY